MEGRGRGWIAYGGPIALAAALALVLAAGPAWAVTCKVPTSTFTKIQDAVDATGPVCDEIVVKKCVSPGTLCGDNGVHHEGVDIDNPGNVGLTLKCKKGVTLDGADPLGQLIKDGIFINKADVTVQGCTVQNFGVDGIKVDAANGITIKKVTLRHNTGDGLDLDGDNYVVEKSTASENGGDGFRFGSNDGTITKNVASGNAFDGFDSAPGGNDNTFTRNKAVGNGDRGFEVDGLRNTLSRNKAETNDGEGYGLGCDDTFDDGDVVKNTARANDAEGIRLCDGDNNVFEKNKATANSSHGFEITEGTDNEVKRNRAEDNADDGFHIVCDDVTTCGGPITNNTAKRNHHDGFSFEQLDTTTVSGNSSKDNGEEGFQCGTCDRVTFTNNKATNNHDIGFLQTGSADMTYDGIKSTKNDDDGIRIEGTPSGTTIKNSKFTKNGADGIDIDGVATTTTIDKNKVTKNGGTGIENDGVDTVITNNKVKKNRTDIAGEGDVNNKGSVAAGSLPLDTTGGNNFDTGAVDGSTFTPNTRRGDNT